MIRTPIKLSPTRDELQTEGTKNESPYLDLLFRPANFYSTNSRPSQPYSRFCVSGHSFSVVPIYDRRPWHRRDGSLCRPESTLFRRYCFSKQPRSFCPWVSFAPPCLPCPAHPYVSVTTEPGRPRFLRNAVPATARWKHRPGRPRSQRPRPSFRERASL